MSYDLGFAPEFFLAEGEPYDRSDLALNQKGKPISLYSAIRIYVDKNRKEALKAAKVPKNNWKLVADNTLAEELFSRAQKVNTCSNITVPVKVWLDPKGEFTVSVYDVP
jgi:hypothetical protein